MSKPCRIIPRIIPRTPSAAARAVLTAALFVQAPQVCLGTGGEETPPPKQATGPTTAATPNQGDEVHASDEDTHHELLREALKAKGNGGSRTAIIIATITTLGGILVAVITTRRYCSRNVRRPKREERRPR